MRFMEIKYYNYNNDELLVLNDEDVTKNRLLIEGIYKDYEILEGEIVIHNSKPFLVINGYNIARVNNDISTHQKLSSLIIKNNTIYAYIEKGLG